MGVEFLAAGVELVAFGLKGAGIEAGDDIALADGGAFFDLDGDDEAALFESQPGLAGGFDEAAIADGGLIGRLVVDTNGFDADRRGSRGRVGGGGALLEGCDAGAGNGRKADRDDGDDRGIHQRAAGSRRAGAGSGRFGGGIVVGALHRRYSWSPSVKLVGLTYVNETNLQAKVSRTNTNVMDRRLDEPFAR